MKSRASSPSIELLLRIIDQAYEKKAWHGPNLRGAVRGLSFGEAARRPAPGRHNIWEIVVHCAYWKYAVRRRILGEKRGSFPLNGSNWFQRPERSNQDSWKNDLRLLDDVHRSMRQAILSLDDRALEVIPRGSRVSNVDIIGGIAAHDLYHAGQIQLIKRLIR